MLLYLHRAVRRSSTYIGMLRVAILTSSCKVLQYLHRCAMCSSTYIGLLGVSVLISWC